MTDIDGGFSLDLDPGGYLVRVEPAQGTRLPWMAKRIVVPTSSPVDFVIPAPAYRGMVLNDVAGNPVASAIVELFAMSDSGTATQVGRATTDTNGRFDVYIDPGLP